MKRKEIQALKEKSTGELQSMLQSERKQLQTLRFDLAAGKVKNVSAIRASRKAIARMLTFIPHTKKSQKETNQGMIK